MNVKEAVQKALKYTQDVLELKADSNLAVEEVEFDDTSDAWKITIGFSRDWDKHGHFRAFAENTPALRQYKVVTVKRNGEVQAIKIRSIDG